VRPTPVLAAGGIGSGRQAAAALALGADGVWTGSIWLTVREADTGEPIVVLDPESPAAMAFEELARRVVKQIESGTAGHTHGHGHDHEHAHTH